MNMKKRKSTSKTIKKYKKYVGGDVGTTGDISTLTSNIEGVIENVVKVMINTTELVYDIFKLPNDFVEQIPYKYPATPGANL